MTLSMSQTSKDKKIQERTVNIQKIIDKINDTTICGNGKVNSLFNMFSSLLNFQKEEPFTEQCLINYSQLKNVIDKTLNLNTTKKLNCCPEYGNHIEIFVLYEALYKWLSDDYIINGNPKIITECKENIEKMLLEIYKEQFKSIKKSRAEITTLYRFMPINKNTYKHLNSEKLYFANPKDFNDPFDCITFRINNIRDINTERYTLKQSIPVLESLVDNNTLKVRCFNEGLINEIPKDWHLMMSHYAQDHKGIIIEYEFDKTKITNDHIRFLKVNYTDDIGVSDIKAGLSNKAKCWNYEKEYRFAYWRDNINSPMEIPLEELGLKISKIIFLCNTSQTDKDNIINSLNIDFNKTPQGNNKISLKSGAEIDMKQVVMKKGYGIEFEIIEQTISLDTQRLKAET